METGKATPQMRKVRFDLLDRIVLIPVELKFVLLPIIIAAVILYYFFGLIPAVAAVMSVFAETILFPVLLPYIPTGSFSSKGFILGIAAALPFSIYVFGSPDSSGVFLKILTAACYILLMSPITAMLSLNFTGATPITSRSEVKREIKLFVIVFT